MLGSISYHETLAIEAYWTNQLLPQGEVYATVHEHYEALGWTVLKCLCRKDLLSQHFGIR